MSVSSWPVTALALRPPGHILAHQIERPTTTPGRAASETRALARKEPRSLKTRTMPPSAMPRARGVAGVDREARLALAPHEDRLRREGRVQEVVRGRRDERERVALARAPGELVGALARRGVAGQRVEALAPRACPRPARTCPTASGSRPRRTAANGSGTLRRTDALALEPLERDPGHARVVPVERLPRHLLVATRAGTGRRAPCAPRGGGRARCSACASPSGRDRGTAEADVEVAVGLVDVVVLERRGGRQQQVGEVRGVGLELLVDDGEQVLAREPAPHRLLVGRDRRRVRVVDEERLHGRIERRVGRGCARAGSC